MGKTFTPEQRVAIETSGSAVALVAGAGSGKTTVLVERYLKLLNEGVSPEQILVVTFTNEAAGQLKEKIIARLDEIDERRKTIEYSSPIGTVHSFCYGILNQYGGAIGLPPIQGILNPFEFITAFNRAYADWWEALPSDQIRTLLGEINFRSVKPLVRTFYEERFALRKTVALLDPALPESQFIRDLWDAAQPLIGQLERDFLSRAIYSFDELEHYTLQVLEQSPETQKKLEATFRYLLVDEFQDTSAVQWEILSRLADGELKKLFVVGDPKQSIYRFRNADVTLFKRVADRMARHGGAVLELTVNFRSVPTLLENINALSEGLFAGNDIGFSPMKSGAAPTSVTALNVVSYDAGSVRTDYHVYETRAVLRELQNLIADKVVPQDIAILFRTSDRMLAYAQQIKALGIPVSVKKTGLLFESYEVLDVVAFLNALANPLDDYLFSAFLRTRFVGFSYGDLVNLRDRPGETLFEKSYGQYPEMAWFFDLIETGETDTHRCLKRLFENSNNYFPREWNALLQILGPLERGGRTHIFEAAEIIRAWQAEDLPLQVIEAEAHAVRLMTVHAAKGLEFKYVILADLLRAPPRRAPILFAPPDGVPAFKIKSASDEENPTLHLYGRLQEENSRADAEESKRVLYVALTRAMHQLIFCLPENPKAMPKGSWAQFLSEGMGDRA